MNKKTFETILARVHLLDPNQLRTLIDELAGVAEDLALEDPAWEVVTLCFEAATRGAKNCNTPN